MEDELMFKIIVIGSMSVGKSNITARFCDNSFYPENVPTLGVDFKYARCSTLESTPRSVRLQVWDTSGQDTFATLTTAFYRNSQGALLCFDLTSRQSFEDLQQWYELLERYTPSLPPLILVGCKSDLVDQNKLTNEEGGLMLGSLREVQQSEGDAWAREHNCLCYLETSARENTNVSQVFQQLTTYLCTHDVTNPRSRTAFRQPFSGKALTSDPSPSSHDSRRCCR